MQSNWISAEEYSVLTGSSLSEVEALIMRGKLSTIVNDGQILVNAGDGMAEIIPATIQELSTSEGDVAIGANFVEKTIGTIINLHEKILSAKEETIDSIKNENEFLKEALASLQELYDEDRHTIATLTEQLKLSQQEVEFMRRKYKLMWGKVIDDYATQ